MGVNINIYLTEIVMRKGHQLNPSPIGISNVKIPPRHIKTPPKPIKTPPKDFKNTPKIFKNTPIYIYKYLILLLILNIWYVFTLKITYASYTAYLCTFICIYTYRIYIPIVETLFSGFWLKNTPSYKYLKLLGKLTRQKCFTVAIYRQFCITY